MKIEIKEQIDAELDSIISQIREVVVDYVNSDLEFDEDSEDMMDEQNEATDYIVQELRKCL